MNVLRSVAMAFSMFSIFPMPNMEWKKENMRYMLSALPLVGAVIGLALWCWLKVSRLLGFGNVLFAAGTALLPILISGGIHLDGFCDTVDALSSHATPERKREILKDPHAGAFALIGISAYVLFYFALCTELPCTTNTVMIMGSIYTLSRALGSFASAVFRPAGRQGLQKTFHDAAGRPVVAILFLWIALCTALLVLLCGFCGGLIVSVAAICLVLLYLTAKRQFGGMSGDLAGYLIQISELGMLLVYVVYQKAVLI